VFATKERGTGILIAASSCPHVVVEERCASGSIVTKVASEGELPCFDGISGSFSIRASGDPSPAHVVPGGVVWLRRGDLKEVDLTVSRGRRTVFEGTVPVDKFAKLSPAVLRGVLKYADDREGFRAFMTLAPRWRTPQLPEEVARLRIERFAERLASSEDAVSIRESMYLDERYPGTTEVREAIDSRLRGEFARLLDAAPSAAGFWRGTKIIDALGDATSDNEKFLAAYGPAVAEAHMQVPPEEAATLDAEFVKRWPRAAWTPQIVERQEKEAVERQIAREKSQHASHLDDLFSELADIGNLVVSWQYKVAWLQQYGPKIRRTEIGVSNMKAGIRLKKQEFCTLKKEFLKEGTATDFRERAKEHCDHEAPVEDLGAGEVDLTKECRIQFASGC